MKKKDIVNLIRCHVDHNEAGFKEQAMKIATEFSSLGDEQLSQYILSLISDASIFTAQDSEVINTDMEFLDLIPPPNSYFPLPDELKDDVLGIVNAISLNKGINKFFFYGPPGTGKTESARHIARLLRRELYSVDFSKLIDSRLGQTSKNISALFDEIKEVASRRNVVILFDEFDSLALDRANSRDLREMGRVTSSVIKQLDQLEDVVLIATSNLYDKFDQAVIRRFDITVDFSRYSQEDLVGISLGLLNNYLSEFGYTGKKNNRLFKKILERLMIKLPFPGDLKNLIRKSIAFSNLNVDQDYLRKFYKLVSPKQNQSMEFLKEKGFSLREIELLTDVSKSQVARLLEKSL